MNHHLALSMPLAICVLGASLAAQGTIFSGNTSYTVGAISTTQTDSVNSMFTANPPADTNLMYEHWFYYRINNDPRQRLISWLPSRMVDRAILKQLRG